MKTIIKKLTVPTEKRLIVTSDIHGHYEHFKRLLKKVQFSENDILFIVGDMIEKGPMSLKTLRYIMELCKNHTVYPLIGNVDAWRLVMFEENSSESFESFFNYIKKMKQNWGACFFSDMCDELNISFHTPDELQKAKEQMRIHFKNEFDFLYSLPTMIETQNFIFVHGGIPCEQIDSLVEEDAFSFLKNDAFMEQGIRFKKYIVVGHWPVTLYHDKIASSNPIINSEQKIISIDGGCGLKQDGQLNALLIPTVNSENFTYAAYDDFPVAIAQTPQKASEDSINIRFTDNKIKILERGDEFTYAEHRSTGYRLFIHNSYIYGFDENSACDDYTDYRLPVQVGDQLSIVKETSKGYLAKKDGISGWYDGDLEYLDLKKE